MNNVDEIIMSLTEIADQPTEDGMVDGVCQQTIRDALELINYQHEHIEAFLRDQEPKRVESVDYGTYLFKRYRCPTCKVFFDHKHNYCPNCGKKVKWDE